MDIFIGTDFGSKVILLIFACYFYGVLFIIKKIWKKLNVKHIRVSKKYEKYTILPDGTIYYEYPNIDIWV